MNESTLTITLSGPVKDFVEAQTAANGHSTPDEFVASILQQFQHQVGEQRLETLLSEGLESPLAPLDTEEWASIRGEARARLANEKRA